MEDIFEKPKKTPKRIFDTEEVKEGFEFFKFEVNQNKFDKMLKEFQIMCPQLTKEEAVTAVVANMMSSRYDSGLSELWEELSLKLKEHYGYPSEKGHGSINAPIKELKEKARKDHEFLYSSPLY